jgi:hypothetical protein
MSILGVKRRGSRITTAVVFFMLILTCFILPCFAGEQAKPVLSPDEQVRLGERIYRDGILPSGEAMQAVVKGDITVPGTSFTCVSCHLRSGLGSFEGGVITTPTNGGKLFQPYKMTYKKVETDTKYLPVIEHRPAYTDQTLVKALREGVNPVGQVMNPVMPRYLLEDDDAALLVSYLKSLSVEFSPGVADMALNFATVITDDVKPAEYEAMLAPLEQYVSHKNNMIQLFKTQKRSERMAAVMMESSELMYKRLTLSRWMLTGPHETWRGQLEEYYRKQPVFALLGGISHGDWRPIHEFSEAHHIPSLFPQTDFPVISETDWYTLYFSKGFYQEGEGAARYLNSRDELSKGGGVIQVVRASREEQAISRGFQETWQELGHAAPVTVVLNAGEQMTVDTLRGLVQKEKPTAILIWDHAGTLPLLVQLAAEHNRPGIVVVAASQLGGNLGVVPEPARTFTYLTFPYRLPQEEVKNNIYIEPYKKEPKVEDVVDPILKRSFITTQMLTSALMDLRGNYYRDNFFDVIGMMGDQRYPLYERLSFGPGQRYASKGCYIVQLGDGARPELIKKSSWVIQ